jgi:GNAT superfamily N-acetyltransferase
MDYRSNAELRIRAADLDDVRPIAAVHVASWRQAYRGLLPDEYLAGLSVDGLVRHWDSVIERLSDDQLLVAEVDLLVVGFVHAGPCRDADTGPCTAELYSLYLQPDAWGVGIGRAIHDAALARLTEDGCDFATLWMLGTNDRARRFYLQQGWSQVAGVRTQQFGEHVVVDDRFGRSLPVI